MLSGTLTSCFQERNHPSNPCGTRLSKSVTRARFNCFFNFKSSLTHCGCGQHGQRAAFGLADLSWKRCSLGNFMQNKAIQRLIDGRKRNFAQESAIQCNWLKRKNLLHSIALLCVVSDGKICVVPVRATPAPVHHLPLLAFGSTESCSARLTVAAATKP